MNWTKSESTIRPETLDTTSSKTTVYLRRGIVEKQRADETSGETMAYYEYEEAKMTHTEYEEYLQVAEAVNMRQTKADVDYIKLYLNIPQ